MKQNDMHLYNLKNGDIFTTSSKKIFDILSMSNQYYIFKPLKHYKKIIWYKPKTWFREIWEIQYIEVGEIL